MSDRTKVFKAIVASAICLMFLSILIPQGASATEVGPNEPWLDGYDFRKSHAVAGESGAGAGYIIGIQVRNGTGTDGTVSVNGTTWGIVYTTPAYADFRDIRFTDDDKVTMLADYKENYSSGNWANFWVRVNDDLNSSVTIEVYWHNFYAVDGSSGESVFPFWDDFANRTNAVWHRQGIVMQLSSAPTNNIAESNVLYDASAQVITGLPSTQKIFKDWFRCFSATSEWLAYAESLDGLTWMVRSTPVLVAGTSMACPFVAKISGIYYLYVGDGLTSRDIYSSADGITWAKLKDNYWPLGSSGAWDDRHLGNTFVWKEGSSWYMLQEARKVGGPCWMTGLATSSDGSTWTKYGGNPVIGSVSPVVCAGGPWVHKASNGTYYAWVHGQVGSNLPSDIFRYHSTDLHTWVSDGTATFYRQTAYEGPNVSDAQVGDPTFCEANGNTYMFYLSNIGQVGSDWKGMGLAVYGNSMDNLVRTYEEMEYDKSFRWTGDTTNLAAVGDGVGVLSADSDTQRIIYTHMTFGTNVQVRYDGSLAHGASNAASFSFRTVSSTQLIQLSHSASSMTAYTAVDGSHYTSMNVALDANRHLYDVYWSPSLVKWNEDGSLLNATITTAANIPNIAMPIAAGARTVGAVTTMHYVWVRPFVNPEPEHGDFGAQEEAYAGTLPIPPIPGGALDNSIWVLLGAAMIPLGLVLRWLAKMRKGA